MTFLGTRQGTRKIMPHGINGNNPIVRSIGPWRLAIGEVPQPPGGILPIHLIHLFQELASHFVNFVRFKSRRRRKWDRPIILILMI